MATYLVSPEPNKELKTSKNDGIPVQQQDKHETKKRNPPWSWEEIAMLKKLYPKGEREELLKKLHGRTWEGIKVRASKLGLGFPKTKYTFSKEELKKLYLHMNVREVSKRLKISKNTFYYLLKRNGILTKKRGDPNLFSSVDLFYILGVLKGDGLTRIREEKHWYILGLATTSEKFAKSFAEALQNIKLTPQLYRYNPPHGHSKKHVSYFVKAASKKFVTWYRNLSYENMQNMIGVNMEFAAAFVKGFYESEGSYYLRESKYPILKIGNMNLQLLSIVRDFILRLGVHVNLGLSGKTGKGKPYWYLHKCGRDVLRFINLIKPCIKNAPSNLGSYIEKKGGNTLCH